MGKAQDHKTDKPLDDNYWHDPPNDKKRGIEHKKWIATPTGGKPDSLGALEIGRINDSMQQEILSPTFNKKLGKVLNRSDKPVFIVRVYLPPFQEWGDDYHFGFRQQTFMKGVQSTIYAYAYDDKYSTSIWVKKDQQ